MDLVKEAIFLGFSGAAVMDTKELVFVPEYRTFCEENLCGSLIYPRSRFKAAPT